MSEQDFLNKYGLDPFYLFARDVVGGELKTLSILEGSQLLEELETFFKLNGHFYKAKNVKDFRDKWKQDLEKEFKSNK